MYTCHIHNLRVLFNYMYMYIHVHSSIYNVVEEGREEAREGEREEEREIKRGGGREGNRSLLSSFIRKIHGGEDGEQLLRDEVFLQVLFHTFLLPQFLQHIAGPPDTPGERHREGEREGGRERETSIISERTLCVHVVNFYL